MAKRYLISTLEWDVYAGEGGEWVWKIFSDGDYTEENIQVIKETLTVAGKTHAIGEVAGSQMID